MNAPKIKALLKRCFWLAAMLGLLVLFGPSLIHLAYRMVTPASVEQAERARYNDLANAEAFDRSLTEEQRRRIGGERLKMFDWFHARGWNIDEDDEEKPWLHPWHELMMHWNLADP